MYILGALCALTAATLDRVERNWYLVIVMIRDTNI
jgi:hypothetical protein